jgi:hypothetical protein
VRKLILTFVLVGFVVVPTALAATDAPSFAPVRDVLTDTPADYTVPADFSEARGKRRQAERLPQLRERRVAERKALAAVPPQLQAIAACESGGDPTAIGGGGLYRGKYQFSVETWAAVGGSGDPAAAPEAEQDRRAAMLYEQSGPGQWPVCGR